MDKSLTLPRKWLRSQWVADFCTSKDSAGNTMFSTRAIDEPDLYLWIKDVHYPQVTAKQYRAALRDLCKEKLPGYKESPLSAELRGLLNTRIKEVGKRLWAHQKLNSKTIPGAAAVAAWEKIDEGKVLPANAKKSLNQDEISISNYNPYEPVFGGSYGSSNVIKQHQQAINSDQQACGDSYSISNTNVQYQQTVPTTSGLTNTTYYYEQEFGGSYNSSTYSMQHQPSSSMPMSSTSNAQQHQKSGNAYTTSSNANSIPSSIKSYNHSTTTQQELGHASMLIQVSLSTKGYASPDNTPSGREQVVDDNSNKTNTHSVQLSMSKQINVDSNDSGSGEKVDRASNNNCHYINNNNDNSSTPSANISRSSSSGNMLNTLNQHSQVNTEQMSPLILPTRVVPKHTEIQKNTSSSTFAGNAFEFPGRVMNSNIHIPTINYQHEYSSQSLNSSPNSLNTNIQHCSHTNLMPTRRLYNSNFGMEGSAEPLPKRLAVARVYEENRDGSKYYGTSRSQTRDRPMMPEPSEHVVSNVASSPVCMSVPTVGIQTPAVEQAVVRPEFDILRIDSVESDVDNDDDRDNNDIGNDDNGNDIDTVIGNDDYGNDIDNDDIDNNDNGNAETDNDSFIDNDDNYNDNDNNDHIAVDMQTTTLTFNVPAATPSTAPSESIAPTVARHAFDVIRFVEEDSDDDDDDDDDDMTCDNLPFQFAEDGFFVPLESEDMKQAFNDINAGLSDFGLVSKSEYQAMEKHYTNCFSNPSEVGFSVLVMTIHTTGRLNCYVNQTFTDFVGKDLTKEAHVIVDHPTSLKGLALITEDNAADMLGVRSCWIDCFDESGKPIKKLADMWFPNIKYNTDEAVLMFTPPNSAAILVRQPGPYPPPS